MTVNLDEWKGYVVQPGATVDLSRTDSGATALCANKKSARAELKQYRKEIDELLRLLAIEEKRSLLVVLQGVDASGKDGAVRRVFTGINPQHCRVVSFKEPTREERAHDYLWRVHRSIPVKGELCVFNRSQYEDLLVPQARGALPLEEGRVRLRQIADLERIWVENGITILKFLLHISYEEQMVRFQSRLDTPEKHWKVKDSDFADRKLWPQFRTAYEEAISRTSTKQAPWYLIPSDHKWYRDVAIAGVVLSTLRQMQPCLPMPELDRARYSLEV
jgi:PPK2 family polyphosphate:nucleotide phosphotransferase